MSSPCVPAREALSRILHACVKQAPSGLDARTIAGIVGVNYQTLMSELSGQPGHKLSADMVLPLCRAAGTVLPLVWLARQLGGVFVALPDPEIGDQALTAAALATMREFGEFAAEVAADIADGHIPDDQLSRIVKEGLDATAAIRSLMLVAEQVNAVQNQRKTGTTAG